MREVIFRGKRKRDQKWVYGSYLHLNMGSDYICGGAVWIGTMTPCKEEVFPETVGQFTGMTDKNGKKIFEGDIVRHDNENPYAIPSIVEKGRVYWDEAFCGWRRTSNGAFHHGIVDTYKLSPMCCYEVIGNIHDNPDLLDEK